MLGKRYNWVPLLRGWNIGMNSDPSARKDGNKTTPHNVPDRPTMCGVRAMIHIQLERAVVDGWDGSGVNRGSLKQVVDKK